MPDLDSFLRAVADLSENLDDPSALPARELAGELEADLRDLTASLFVAWTRLSALQCTLEAEARVIAPAVAAYFQELGPQDREVAARILARAKTSP
jgi:hypothetical protein